MSLPTFALRRSNSIKTLILNAVNVVFSFCNSEKNLIFIPAVYFVVSATDAFHQPKPNDTLTKTIQSTGLQKTRGLLNDNQRMPSKMDGNKIRNLESVQPKP